RRHYAEAAGKTARRRIARAEGEQQQNADRIAAQPHAELPSLQAGTRLHIGYARIPTAEHHSAGKKRRVQAHGELGWQTRFTHGGRRTSASAASSTPSTSEVLVAVVVALL